jgi:tripartite-type tricarboxylate transporter receptor subunit TctC
MRAHRLVRTLVALASLAVALAVVTEASSQESYFKGKTVRFLVGYAPGGGFDTYSRTVARHLGRYLPGHPTVIVENMPGAGGLIAANHLYKIARPDGLTIGHFIGSLLTGQVLGQKGIEFDARRFEYVGSPARAHSVCAFTKASGITTVEQWMGAKTPPKLGGVAVGTTVPDNAIKVLKTALGLPVQLVSGYKGTADIRLASEGGELAGSCWSWSSIRATWRKALEAGEVGIVLQLSPTPFPELANVPLAISLARTEEARKLIQVAIHDDASIVYQYALPPGTPKDRVLALRKALQETLRDREFLADAQKAKLEIDPVTGEEIERSVAGLFGLDRALVARLKEVLFQ